MNNIRIENNLIGKIEKNAAALYSSPPYAEIIKTALLSPQPYKALEKYLLPDPDNVLLTKLPIMQFFTAFFLLDALRYLYKETHKTKTQQAFKQEHAAVLKKIKQLLINAFNQPITQSTYVKALFLYAGEWALEFPEADPEYNQKITKARKLLEKLAAEDYKPARFWLAFILIETGQQEAGFEHHYQNVDYPPSLIALGTEYVDYLNKEQANIKPDDYPEERRTILRHLALLSSKGHPEATALFNKIQLFCETLANKDNEYKNRFSVEINTFKEIATKNDSQAAKKYPQKTKHAEAEQIGQHAGMHIGSSLFATVGAGGGSIIGGLAGTALLGPIGTVLGTMLGMLTGAVLGNLLGQIITEQLATDITLLIDWLASLIKISVPSEVKEVGVTSAVIGLLIGSVLGSLLIPIPGVGTVLGFALGTAIGGAGGAIAGGLIGGISATFGRLFKIAPYIIKLSANMALTGAAFGSVLGGIIGMAILPGPGMLIGAAIGGGAGALGVGSITCIAAQLLSKYKPFPEMQLHNELQERKAVERSACLSVGLSIGIGLGGFFAHVLSPVLEVVATQIIPIVQYACQLAGGLIVAGIGYVTPRLIKPLTLSPDKQSISPTLAPKKHTSTDTLYTVLAMQRQQRIQQQKTANQTELPQKTPRPDTNVPQKTLFPTAQENIPTLKLK